MFGGRVERSRRLVEDEQQWFGAHHRPTESEGLPLSAGEFGAVAKLFSELAVETFGKATGKVGASGAFECSHDRVGLVDVIEVADTDGVPRHELVAHVVLERGGGSTPPLVEVDSVEPRCVDGNGPEGGCIEAHEQLDERRLARTVFPDDCDDCTGRNMEVQLGENRRVGSRVGEGDIGEVDAVLDPVRRGLESVVAGARCCSRAAIGSGLRRGRSG